MFTKFLSLVDVFHAFLISLNRKFVLWFDVFFVSVARHLDSTPCDAAAKGEVFGGRACACFHGGMDGSVLGVKNETTSIWFPLPFAARVFIVFLICQTSYHLLVIIPMAAFYARFTSIKGSQVFDSKTPKLWTDMRDDYCNGVLLSLLSRKFFCRNAGKNHGRHHVLCGTKQCSPERWGLEESFMISWLHHLDP